MQEKSYVQFQNTGEILAHGKEARNSGREATLIKLLMARALHPARTGDFVVVDSKIDPGFPRYLQAVTGEHPQLLSAFIVDIIGTNDIYTPILNAHQQGLLPSDAVLNPYLQSKVAGGFSLDTGVPMAYTPAETLQTGLVEKLNNKAYLRTVAPHLNIPMVDADVIESYQYGDVYESVKNLLSQGKSAFVQASDSGGGYGNKMIENIDELEAALPWMEKMHEMGSEKLIVAEKLPIEASHSVSGFIPPNGGEPIVYGIFKQVLDEENGYLGFEYPGQDKYTEEFGKEMMDAAKNWFKHIQKLGYVGPSDLDYFITEYKGSRGVFASESNTRWDGFSPTLMHAARTQGWNQRTLEGIHAINSPALRAIDHVPTSGHDTDTLVQKLVDAGIPLLGMATPAHPDDREGVVIMVPPKQHGNHYQTALAVLSPSIDQTRKIFTDAEEALQ
jgi:hypothetical protein